MADLNKVFLMGRLTFDPELRRTPGGTAVTELRLATTQVVGGPRRRAPRGNALHRRDGLGSPGRELLPVPAEGELGPRRGLAEDGHLGRQEHGREAVEDPRARRPRAVPGRPTRLIRGAG